MLLRRLLKPSTISLLNLYSVQNLQCLRQASYQFKTVKPFYYPNRELERERSMEQQKLALVENNEKRQLPKDYYYKVLACHRNSTVQEIKANYYALARRFHPDAKNASSPTHSKAFQEINNAYHILTDENKRLEYDQLGMVRDEQEFLANVRNLKVMPQAAAKGRMAMATNEQLFEITQGEQHVEISFLEAAQGAKKNADLAFIKKCTACGGAVRMQLKRAQPELCMKCGGTGSITRKTATYQSLSVCDQCKGKRYLSRTNCDKCENRGIIMDSVRISIPIPPASKTGDIVRVINPKTQERVSYRITVKTSDYFSLRGNNVHTVRYLNISEAVLGGNFKVRGLYEDLSVKLEAGTESHKELTIKGKGLKSRDGVGDHIVTFKVRIPTELSMKQRQIMLAWAKTEEPTFLRSE